jgi:assimilatory nitrate reductase catalytic subunit
MNAADYRASTGRVLAHYQSGTQTKQIAQLNDLARSHWPSFTDPPACRTSPMAIASPSRRDAAAAFRLKVTPHVREDTLFVPFHWGGEGSANRLTTTRSIRRARCRVQGMRGPHRRPPGPDRMTARTRLVVIGLAWPAPDSWVA